MRAHKTFLIFSALLAGAAVAAGCGGSSSRTAGDDGDQAGTGGDAGTGAQGGSSNGGTSVGGSSTGGTSVGGSSTGGTSVGGSSTGGMSTGGVAGTRGGSGGGGICSLPLVSGNCNAYFPSFGFSTTDGNCQPFVYGGCGGNENRFETLAECEATCGGSLGTCPPRTPHRLECNEEGRVCTYDLENCLCAQTAVGLCSKLDSACTALDGGVSPIIVAGWQRCSCTNGAWVCQLGG